MATLDASIYGQQRQAQFPDPIQQYSRLAQLQGAINQQDMQRIQMDEMQRSRAEEAQLRDLFARSGGDVQKAIPELYRSGLYKPAMAIEKQQTETRAKQAEISKNEAETVLKGHQAKKAQLERISSVFGSVAQNPTPESAQMALAALKQDGINVERAEKMLASGMPIQAWAQQLTMEGVTADKQIEDQRQRAEVVYANLGGVSQPRFKVGGAMAGEAIPHTITPEGAAADARAAAALAEQQKHNRATEGTAAGQLGVAQGRLDVERDKAKRPEYGDAKEFDSPTGRVLVQQDKRTGDWVDANTKQPVPGLRPQPKEIPPEASGRIAMLRQANSDIDLARSILFDADGNLNRGVLARSQVGGGLGTKGRELVSSMENAVSAKYRLETGAAGNKDEEISIRKRFMPNSLDTAESAKFKLDRLQEFMQMGFDQMRDSGYLSKDTVAKVPSAKPSVTANPGTMAGAQETRRLGGKTYLKINGQWMEQ